MIYLRLNQSTKNNKKEPRHNSAVPFNIHKLTNQGVSPAEVLSVVVRLLIETAPAICGALEEEVVVSAGVWLLCAVVCVVDFDSVVDLAVASVVVVVVAEVVAEVDAADVVVEEMCVVLSVTDSLVETVVFLVVEVVEVVEVTVVVAVVVVVVFLVTDWVALLVAVFLTVVLVVVGLEV